MSEGVWQKLRRSPGRALVIDKCAVYGTIIDMKLDPKKLKKLAMTLEEFNKDVTPEERKMIDMEFKYYVFTSALRKKRKSLGLTQEKLSKLSKVPRTTITKIESGSRNTTLETLKALAHSMGSTIEIKFT